MVWDVYATQPYMDGLVAYYLYLGTGFWAGYLYGLLRARLRRIASR